MYGAQTVRLLVFISPVFENDVEMYGAQTGHKYHFDIPTFENDVEMYGAQTKEYTIEKTYKFENDVEMYGAQTPKCGSAQAQSLRMMQKCMVLKQVAYGVYTYAIV